MTASLTAALALAALIGLSLGLMGSGGSIVTLPMLVYVARVPAEVAVAMSLAIVGGTSLIGGAPAWGRGDVQTRETLLFAATGMIGALLGSQATHLASPAVLMLSFAALMLVVGLRMLLGVRAASLAQPAELRPVRFVLVGLAVGALTGFLGVGGGFLVVPALVFFGGFRSAVRDQLVVDRDCAQFGVGTGGPASARGHRLAADVGVSCHGAGRHVRGASRRQPLLRRRSAADVRLVGDCGRMRLGGGQPPPAGLRTMDLFAVIYHAVLIDRLRRRSLRVAMESGGLLIA